MLITWTLFSSYSTGLACMRNFSVLWDNFAAYLSYTDPTNYNIFLPNSDICVDKKQREKTSFVANRYCSKFGFYVEMNTFYVLKRNVPVRII